jgi:hypothetical protein
MLMITFPLQRDSGAGAARNSDFFVACFSSAPGVEPVFLDQEHAIAVYVIATYRAYN